jgi:hypothetical protein
MPKRIKKYLNIYVVTGLIGFFSFLYMLSFIFVLHDVANGSSLQMEKDRIAKEKRLK